VREESHLDDMRSAIRGDFERLAERLGEQELMRVSVSEPYAEPEVERPLEPEPEPDAEELLLEPEPEEPARSWLARLFSPP
jgi:hypothetical protein